MVVRMKPDGPLPGMMNRAMTPAIRPKTIQSKIPIPVLQVNAAEMDKLAEFAEEL
jgi:hypothetical protein